MLGNLLTDGSLEFNLITACACRDQMLSFMEMLAINDCHRRRPNRAQRRASAQLPLATSAGQQLLHGMGDLEVGHTLRDLMTDWRAGSLLRAAAQGGRLSSVLCLDTCESGLVSRTVWQAVLGCGDPKGLEMLHGVSDWL